MYCSCSSSKYDNLLFGFIGRWAVLPPSTSSLSFQALMSTSPFVVFASCTINFGPDDMNLYLFIMLIMIGFPSGSLLTAALYTCYATIVITVNHFITIHSLITIKLYSRLVENSKILKFLVNNEQALDKKTTSNFFQFGGVATGGSKGQRLSWIANKFSLANQKSRSGYSANQSAPPI